MSSQLPVKWAVWVEPVVDVPWLEDEVVWGPVPDEVAWGVLVDDVVGFVCGVVGDVGSVFLQIWSLPINIIDNVSVMIASTYQI